MNLERIFFLTKESKVDFSEIVRKVASFITDYSIHAKLSMFQIDVALNDRQGLIDGEFHSGGCQFVFQEYHEGNPIKFKLTFEGEGKRFKIEFETNGSNPDGFISYFVEPDCTSILHKKIKEYLSVCSKPKSIETKGTAEKQIGQSKSTEAKEDKQTEVVQEEKETLITESFETVKESNPEDISKDMRPVNNPTKLATYFLADHQNKTCACPKDNEMYIMSQEYDLAEITNRVRKLFYMEKDGEVGIYKCEHCGAHFLLEHSDHSYIQLLKDKTFQYLLQMKPQLIIVIEDKGANALRKLMLT